MERAEIPSPTPGRAPSHSPPDVLYTPGRRLNRSLGWFSIGLGCAEIFARRRLARALGIVDSPVLLPVMGVREIVTGVGILASPRPTHWLWARVAGDVLDLAFLGASVTPPGAAPRKVLAMVAVGGVAAVDLATSVASTAVDRFENAHPKYHATTEQAELDTEADALPAEATSAMAGGVV